MAGWRLVSLIREVSLPSLLQCESVTASPPQTPLNFELLLQFFGSTGRSLTFDELALSWRCVSCAWLSVVTGAGAGQSNYSSVSSLRCEPLSTVSTKMSLLVMHTGLFTNKIATFFGRGDTVFRALRRVRCNWPSLADLQLGSSTGKSPLIPCCRCIDAIIAC